LENENKDLAQNKHLQNPLASNHWGKFDNKNDQWYFTEQKLG